MTHLLKFSLLFCVLLTICVLQTEAQDIVGISEIHYSKPARHVGGFSGTYVDYTLADYYDPIVQYGYLFDTIDPEEALSEGSGIGYNSQIYVNGYPTSLIGFTVWHGDQPYPGGVNHLNTIPYRPGRTYCTYTSHRIRAYYYYVQQSVEWGYDPWGVRNALLGTGEGNQSGWNFPYFSPVYVNYRDYPLRPPTEVCLQLPYDDPQIASINPSGSAYDSVVPVFLTGSSFVNPRIEVSGSGVTANIVSSTQTTITATFTVANGVALGDREVRVIADGGTSNPVTFRVGDHTPQISSITPQEGIIGQNVAVTIQGNYFAANPSLLIDGDGITYRLDSANNSEIRATLTISNNAAAGNRTIRVVSRGISGTGFVATPGWSDTSNGVGFNLALARVSSVSFEAINSVIDPNPQTGGGTRIFPDRQTLLPNEPNRRIVRVRARLSSPTSNVRIYFRSFDVDDPSANTLPLDDESLPEDNRGTVGASRAGRLSSNFADTDANGEAIVNEFEVTMQPGDNFAVAASIDQNYLNAVTVNGADLIDGNGAAIPISSSSNLPARRTEMLTVWRKLQIEVDSMGTIDGNFVLGTTGSYFSLKPRLRRIIALNPSPANPLEENRFENGRMYFVDGSSVKVLLNSPTTATIYNDTSSIITFDSGTQFQLVDDDDYNSTQGPGTLHGDNGEDVDETPQAFALMRDNDDLNCDDGDCNLFASAYIRPNYSWARQKGYDQNVIFDLTFNGTDQQLQTFLENLPSSRGDEQDDFWVAHIFLAYQADYTDANGAQFTDNDPSTEIDNSLSGIAYADVILTLPPGGTVPDGSRSSAVFMETVKDQDNYFTTNPDPNNINLPNFRISTAPHELGHQLGLDGDTVAGYGIMSYGEPLVFVPEHLNILRARAQSPGQN